MFVDKKDNKLKIYIDHYAFNKITIKFFYHVLHIDNLLNQVNGAKKFNQIDLKMKYYQIHIVDKDVEKMTMRTRYGLYEFLVMPFGLCNALSIFITFMNSIFHEKLDKSIIIYIDDILVYPKTREEHAKHLEYVLNKLWQNKLFTTNRAKNEFAQEELDFLGHILLCEGMRLNLKKLQAIKNWKRLIMVKIIQSFLGMANLY